MLFGQGVVEAQSDIQFSAFPGYHLINSDKISADSGVSQTDWIFGGSLAARFRANDIPFEYAIGYSQGTSTILETSHGFDPMISHSVDLRYRTIPQELFWVTSLSERIELLTGVNITAQDRTFKYSFPEVDDDRLFNLGLGLSGKLHMVLSEFGSGNGYTFLNLSARWTEFIYHDAQGRSLDDFEMRHLVVSPQFGVSYQF